MAHLTREEIYNSGKVAPEYQKAFEARPVDITGTDFNEHRESRAKHLEKLRHLYPIPGPIPQQVKETLHDVPTRDGSSIKTRVYQPMMSSGEGPLIIMYHEGGWCMGDLTDEDMNCRMFARDLGAVCVNVDYRLAPEHKFPTGVNDCWDAVKWAIAHSKDLGADPTKGLIVGGASAGGNIAAVLALLSRNEQLNPPITGQFLSVPALLPDSNVPDNLAHLYNSRTENTKDPVLKGIPPGAVEAVYEPVKDSPLWDPFSHPRGHRGIAKAFFQVAGLDPLRDEAIMYDSKLREAGVLTRFEFYPGYGHMFWTNYPELAESERYARDTLAGVQWLLGY